MIYDDVLKQDKVNERFTHDNYLENPQKYGGVKYERMGKIISISQDHFYFELGARDIKVIGSGIKRPILGETVVYVHYRKDGVIELIDYHNYNYNYLLYGVSVIALLIFIMIFFMEWKITWRGFKDA